MKSPAEIIRTIYEKLAAGDVAVVLDLIAADIEWIRMWHYKVTDPARYAHVRTIGDGLIVRFRQHIDTLAVEEARS